MTCTLGQHLDLASCVHTCSRAARVFPLQVPFAVLYHLLRAICPCPVYLQLFRRTCTFVTRPQSATPRSWGVRIPNLQAGRHTLPLLPDGLHAARECPPSACSDATRSPGSSPIFSHPLIKAPLAPALPGPSSHQPHAPMHELHACAACARCAVQCVPACRWRWRPSTRR